MEGPQQDHKEHHLEEGDKDVGRGNHEADDTQDGGDGALNNGQTEAIQAVAHLVVWWSLAVQVVVGDVSGEINRKSEKWKFYQFRLF